MPATTIPGRAVLPGLKPEIKWQWIRALRSDDYAQGKGALTRCTPDGRRFHCCLGVLCDLAVKAGVVGVDHPGDCDILGYGEHRSAGLPPLPVVQWAFGPDAAMQRGQAAWLVDWTPLGIDDDGLPLQTDLPALNDGWGLTFAQIADVIEEYL